MNCRLYHHSSTKYDGVEPPSCILLPSLALSWTLRESTHRWYRWCPCARAADEKASSSPRLPETRDPPAPGGKARRRRATRSTRRAAASPRRIKRVEMRRRRVHYPTGIPPRFCVFVCFLRAFVVLKTRTLSLRECEKGGGLVPMNIAQRYVPLRFLCIMMQMVFTVALYLDRERSLYSGLDYARTVTVSLRPDWTIPNGHKTVVTEYWPCRSTRPTDGSTSSWEAPSRASTWSCSVFSRGTPS